MGGPQSLSWPPPKGRWGLLQAEPQMVTEQMLPDSIWEAKKIVVENLYISVYISGIPKLLFITCLKGKIST